MDDSVNGPLRPGQLHHSKTSDSDWSLFIPRCNQPFPASASHLSPRPIASVLMMKSVALVHSMLMMFSAGVTSSTTSSASTTHDRTVLVCGFRRPLFPSGGCIEDVCISGCSKKGLRRQHLLLAPLEE